MWAEVRIKVNGVEAFISALIHNANRVACPVNLASLWDEESSSVNPAFRHIRDVAMSGCDTVFAVPLNDVGLVWLKSRLAEQESIDFRILLFAVDSLVAEWVRDVQELASCWDLRTFFLRPNQGDWVEARSSQRVAELISDGGLLYLVPVEQALSITAVVHSSGLSGAERSHAEFVGDMATLGVLVHTILPEPDAGLGTLLSHAGGTFTFVPTPDWWTLGRPTWVQSFVHRPTLDTVRSIGSDIVLTQTIVIPQGAVAAAVLGLPHVWWIREFGDLDHGLLLPLPPAALGEVIWGLSDSVLTNSRAVRDHFFPGAPESATVVHPLPRLLLRDRMKSATFGDGPLRITVVGALQANKGQEDAIVAVSLLTRLGRPCRLRLAGSGTPSEIERLRQLARDLGVEWSVDFPGQLTAPEQIYANTDVVAVTSRSEAFGRVACEAQALGLPVVYARSGGMPEYMVDNVTGLSYSPGDAEGLCAQLMRLSDEPALRAELVERAAEELAKRLLDRNRTRLLLTHLKAVAVAGPRTSSTKWSAAQLATAVLEGQEETVAAIQRVSDVEDALKSAEKRRDRLVCVLDEAMSLRADSLRAADFAAQKADSAVAQLEANAARLRELEAAVEGLIEQMHQQARILLLRTQQRDEIAVAAQQAVEARRVLQPEARNHNSETTWRPRFRRRSSRVEGIPLDE